MNTLKFNLAELLHAKEGESKQFYFDEKIPDFEPNVEIKSNLVGSVNFIRIKSGILAKIKAKVSANIICARCEEKFRVDFPLDFMEEYEERDKISKDPEFARIGENGEVHILPKIQQEIQVLIPIKPLCKTSCKGICPNCGKDLNQKPCFCKPVDKKSLSPFAALKKLKK